MILANRLKGTNVPLRFEYVDQLNFNAGGTTASTTVTVPAWARSCIALGTHNWQLVQQTQRIDSTTLASVGGTQKYTQIGSGSPYPEYGCHLVMYAINGMATGSQTWEATRVVNANIKGQLALFACNRQLTGSSSSDDHEYRTSGTSTNNVDTYRNGLVCLISKPASGFTSSYDYDVTVPAAVGGSGMFGYTLPTADGTGTAFDAATMATNSGNHSTVSFDRWAFT